jgi:hypothetical protein
MSGEGEQTYQVGYKKPPIETRFKKGTSGYPSGRPKNRAPQKDAGKILQHIDNEEIVVTIDGKRKRMLKAEVLFQKQFTKAIKGNLKTARLILKMATRYFGPEAQGPSEVRFVIGPDDRFSENQGAASKGKQFNVGYCKPPEDREFKKGRSGNPKGRPKQDEKQLSEGRLFRKVAWGQAPIEIDGRRLMVPRWQLYLRTIYNMALNDNDSAARLLDQVRRHFPGDALPGDPITFIISESDANL